MVETEKGLAERFIESAREAGFKDEKLEFLASSQSALKLLERRANEIVGVDYSAPCNFMGVEASHDHRGARPLYDLSKARITRVDGSCWNDSRTRVFNSHKWGDVLLLAALIVADFRVPIDWHRKPDTVWFQHILFPNEVSFDSKAIPALVRGSNRWSGGLISSSQLNPNLWVLDVSDCIVAIA